MDDKKKIKTFEENMEEISREIDKNKEIMRKELGFSFEHFELSELLKPPASFVDEMLKIFEIKNLPVENNYENKYREKRDSDEEPYFNYKTTTPDDSLNSSLLKDSIKINKSKSTQQCEMQIYKTDKPFFLRPCSSYKIIKPYLENIDSNFTKNNKKKWTVESPVKDYIIGNKKKSNLKHSSMQNLNEKKEIRFEPIKNAISFSQFDQNDDQKTEIYLPRGIILFFLVG